MPPEGARLVMGDGSVVPLELVYDGRSPDGVHQWMATTTWRLTESRCSPVLHVDRLPARTSIIVNVIPPGS